MSSSVDFKQQLKRQLGNLRRSCDSYDAGAVDESVRIAVILRLLFRETRNQTPLIRHLEAMGIRLLSTVRPIPPGAVFFEGMGVTQLRIVNGVASAVVVPLLGPYRVTRLLAVADWWQQVVWMPSASTRISRSDLILGAADKDGGAHVDEKLSPNYGALAQDGAAGTLVTRDGSSEHREPLSNAHLAYLRQIGQEVLASEELWALSAP